MTPTVSVVIPTFNRSTLVPNAIESVLAQTYTDYELIIIDDGSTDDTRDSLAPYKDRIRYFHQENRGASAAQNKGIEVARGKWVSILASDDVWLPTKLECQIKALTTLGGSFGACYTNCILLGKHRGTSATVFDQAGINTHLEFGSDDNPLTEHLVGDMVIWVQSLMTRRSLLMELSGFDETLVVREDQDLIVRLALKTSFCFVSAPLVRINQDSSIPHLSDLCFQMNEQRYADHEYVLRKWLSLPELVDHPGPRAMVQDRLRGVYYSWAAARIYQLKILGAVRKLNDIRAMGDSYMTIVTGFLYRAARKLTHFISVAKGAIGPPGES